MQHYFQITKDDLIHYTYTHTHTNLKKKNTTMPSNKSVDYGLDLIKKDPSKILGLTVGKHEITEPGQYVPRAGKFSLSCRRRGGRRNGMGDITVERNLNKKDILI